MKRMWKALLGAVLLFNPSAGMTTEKKHDAQQSLQQELRQREREEWEEEVKSQEDLIANWPRYRDDVEMIRAQRQRQAELQGKLDHLTHPQDKPPSSESRK